MFNKILNTLFFITIVSVISILIIDAYIRDSAKDKLYYSIKNIPEKRVGVILGTSKYVKRGKINYFYKYRIDATAKLFKAGKIRAILVSGDNASRYYNEPKTMRLDLIRAGIPKSKIYLDFAGFRTLDSIQRAKEIFGLKEYIIISQKFHLERAIFIAQKSGVDAIGFVAKDMPNTRAALRMQLREYLARTKAFLDIYVLHTVPKFFGKYEKIEIKENR